MLRQDLPQDLGSSVVWTLEHGAGEKGLPSRVPELPPQITSARQPLRPRYQGVDGVNGRCCCWVTIAAAPACHVGRARPVLRRLFRVRRNRLPGRGVQRQAEVCAGRGQRAKPGLHHCPRAGPQVSSCAGPVCPVSILQSPYVSLCPLMTPPHVQPVSPPQSPTVSLCSAHGSPLCDPLRSSSVSL